MEFSAHTDGRAALEGILRARFPQVAFSIQGFSKTNGVSLPPMYEMHYVATIEFPNGVAPPSKGVFEDLMAGGDIQGRLMMLANKGFRIAAGNNIRQRTVMQANSTIAFIKSERGWTYSTD